MKKKNKLEIHFKKCFVLMQLHNEKYGKFACSFYLFKSLFFAQKIFMQHP